MSVFKNRQFMLHWGAVGVGQLAAFCSALALPWLVLSTSGNNALAMSGMVALNSLPYAFFILFGGALADRLTPLRVLRASRFALLLLTLAFAVLVYQQMTPYWLLALFALLSGTLNAFAVPAGESLLPAIMPRNELGKGNALIIGTTYLAQILGPMLAGWLLWFGRTLQGLPPGEVDYTSLALAFGVNAGGNALALLLMWRIRPVASAKADSAPRQPLLAMISAGLRFCWQDRGIRIVLGYLLLISFFLQGPMAAVLPILAKVQLGLSEAQFGTLFAMTGVGTILGAGLAVLLKPAPRILGQWVLCCNGISGLCLFLLGQASSLLAACLLLLGMGIMGGFIMIAGTTWFQQRTPIQYMGRVMSILMFTIIGMVPLSAALCGYLVHLASLGMVMQGCAAIIMTCAVGGLLIPAIRQMGSVAPLKSG